MEQEREVANVTGAKARLLTPAACILRQHTCLVLEQLCHQQMVLALAVPQVLSNLLTQTQLQAQLHMPGAADSTCGSCTHELPADAYGAKQVDGHRRYRGCTSLANLSLDEGQNRTAPCSRSSPAPCYPPGAPGSPAAQNASRAAAGRPRTPACAARAARRAPPP